MIRRQRRNRRGLHLRAGVIIKFDENIITKSHAVCLCLGTRDSNLGTRVPDHIAGDDTGMEGNLRSYVARRNIAGIATRDGSDSALGNKQAIAGLDVCDRYVVDSPPKSPS